MSKAKKGLNHIIGLDDLDHIFYADTNIARVSLMMTKTICTDVGRPVQIHLQAVYDRFTRHKIASD